MDNIRIFLWMGFLTLVWLGFNQWVEDYGPPPPPNGVEAEQTPTSIIRNGDEQLPNVVDTTALPQIDTAPTSTVSLDNPIRVRTDVLDVIIDPAGGDIVQADLLEYPVTKDAPDDLVRLLNFAPGTRWVFNTGVRHSESENGPTHIVEFSSRSSNYELANGRDELVVSLDWADGNGLTAHKNYTFKRGQYEIDLDIQVQNETNAPWGAVAYSQMVREHIPRDRSFMDVDTYSYIGPVLYDGDRSDKPEVEDLEIMPIVGKYTNGWFASIQHHFLAAVVPTAGEAFNYQASASAGTYVLTAIGDIEEIPPQTARNFSSRFFIGPKLQDQLRSTAEGLELTVDYGFLTALAQPLFWLLRKAFSFLGNWGLAIISVTFLIKLAFYKLTATSGRSMAKMRKIAPRMQALKERHGDDRQALSQSMMELYKKEKVNPAAGCLPILIQMPFFFAFYWVLIESVEMRQAPFMLWINDLSVRDPFFILPLLMGAAMFLQTKLNPSPPDPVQAKIMQFMPLVFCGMFAFFPAGLVLYWLTNTVLSIAQQWRINKIVAAEA